MQDFNVVVTLRSRGGAPYGKAVHLLKRFGPVARSEFFNVLLMKTADQRAFLEALRGLAADDPELFEACLSRALPVARTFHFDSPEAFEARAREAVLELVPALAGKSFHVRVHRRGFKGRLSSLAEEQLLDGCLLEAVERSGSHATVSFDDPDAIVALEIVGGRAGVSLWTRDDRSRYPFLHLD